MYVKEHSTRHFLVSAAYYPPARRRRVRGGWGESDYFRNLGR